MSILLESSLMCFDSIQGQMIFNVTSLGSKIANLDSESLPDFGGRNVNML